MLNAIFVVLILGSVLIGAWTGNMQAVTDAILKSSGTAVDLAIKLIGLMAFFLGLSKVAEAGGLLRLICRLVGPAMRRLFPGVPPEHPAMSSMVLNIGSNMLGLGNAATPFGIRAIEQLDSLNGKKGTATNAMVLFLTINTAGLALLPTGVVAMRTAAGSANPVGIWFPTWIASGCATLVGLAVAILLSRLARFRASEPPTVQPPATHVERDAMAELPSDEPIAWRRVAMWGFWAIFVALAAARVNRIWQGGTLFGTLTELASSWVMPAIVIGMLLFGWSRGVKVYDVLVEGAKEGWHVAVRIIPFLVAILVGIGMFRASGGMDMLVTLLQPMTGLIGMPAEALPMAILRPLTGSGALGYMVETMTTHGPDSLIGYMVSTFQGSTETTFYVLAVYYGAVGVKNTRHTLPACLAADAAGILAATVTVNLMLG